MSISSEFEADSPRQGMPAKYGDARPIEGGATVHPFDNYLRSFAYPVFKSVWLKYKPANGKGGARSSDNLAFNQPAVMMHATVPVSNVSFAKRKGKKTAL